MSVNLINASHDGLATMYSGVGRVSYNYVQLLVGLNNFKKTSLKINIAHQPVKISSPLYNQQLINEIDKVISRSNGKRLILDQLPPIHHAKQAWGGVEHWNASSRVLADTVAKEVRACPNTQHVLIAHDSIYAKTRKFINLHHPDIAASIRFFWVVHSLGDVFKDKFSGTERSQYEQEAFRSLFPQDRVIAVSNFMEKLLTKKLPDKNKILKVLNGWSPDHLSLKAAKQIPEASPKYTIILSGRTTPQKGMVPFFKAILEMVTKAVTCEIRIRLFACTETDESDYFNQIKELIRKLERENVEVVLNSNFVKDAPLGYLRNLEFGCFAFPSLYETSGMSIAEALLVRNPSVTIVHSDIAAFNEITKDEYNIKKINPLSSESIKNTFTQFLSDACNDNQFFHFKNKNKYSFETSLSFLLETIINDHPN